MLSNLAWMCQGFFLPSLHATYESILNSSGIEAMLSQHAVPLAACSRPCKQWATLNTSGFAVLSYWAESTKKKTLMSCKWKERGEKKCVFYLPVTSRAAGCHKWEVQLEKTNNPKNVLFYQINSASGALKNAIVLQYVGGKGRDGKRRRRGGDGGGSGVWPPA